LNARIDGQLFRRIVREAALVIEENKQKLNDLNVFPVPDGDTGTNMSLTLNAASKALENRNDADVGTIADAAAMALLRGARGNSGVILSLLFRGIAKTLKGSADVGGTQFANALMAGTDAAYRAVMKPTEGTILTVSKVAAGAAQMKAETTDNCFEIIIAAYEAGKTALSETTKQNPVLARAGVVDAGGAGWVMVLSTMMRVLRGDPTTAPASGAASAQYAPAQTAPASAQAIFSADEITFAYCTEFIVDRKGSREPMELRAYLEGIGDCVVVVDDEEIIKVHVHTNDPGLAIQEALTFGSLDRVKIENMRLQHTEVMGLPGMPEESMTFPEVTQLSSPAEPAEEPQVPVGFVAVVSGEGLCNVFRDLGVHRLVEGGQTMNPSTMDILEAIEAVPSDMVFVLPNNKNIIMAAQQAIPLTEKTLYVLPTVSIPQGITAMLTYDPELLPEENRAAMEAAFATTHTAQLTYAARDSNFDGQIIREGDYLSLLDGKMVDVSHTEERAVERLVGSVGNLPELAYITIFYGEGVTEERADAVRASLARVCPNAELTVLYGGQPIYYYIISAE